MRKVLYTLGLIAILESIYFAVTHARLGFPDGHLTELDQFRKAAYPYFFKGLAALGTAQIVSAWHKKAVRPLTIVGVVTQIAIVATEAITAMTFDHGQGG